jgi:ERF superfamily
MQQLGSATSYARRYALQAIVGISQTDDDGESLMDRPKPGDFHNDKESSSVSAIKPVENSWCFSVESLATIEALAERSGMPLERVYEWCRKKFKGLNPEDLNEDQFNILTAKLRQEIEKISVK